MWRCSCLAATVRPPDGDEHTKSDSASGKGRPGRPRSTEAEQAILKTTLDLLCDVGIEGLSIERVAALAGVGKTTIYRRWASKEELIQAAIQNIRAMTPLVETGDLRADMLALVRATTQGSTSDVINRLFPRLLAESATRPDLFKHFMDADFTQRLNHYRGMVERAQARGEVRADVDPVVVFDLLGGACLLGWQLFHKLTPLGPDFAEQVVDTIWRGIRATP